MGDKLNNKQPQLEALAGSRHQTLKYSSFGLVCLSGQPAADVFHCDSRERRGLRNLRSTTMEVRRRSETSHFGVAAAVDLYPQLHEAHTLGLKCIWSDCTTPKGLNEKGS